MQTPVTLALLAAVECIPVVQSNISALLQDLTPFSIIYFTHLLNPAVPIICLISPILKPDTTYLNRTIYLLNTVTHYLECSFHYKCCKTLYINTQTRHKCRQAVYLVTAYHNVGRSAHTIKRCFQIRDSAYRVVSLYTTLMIMTIHTVDSQYQIVRDREH